MNLTRWLATTLIFLFSGAAFAEDDSFQQVINYITTGNPLTQSNSIVSAEIYDRGNCIAGFTDNLGGTFKIHWNNVDPKSIDVREEWVPGDEWLGTTGSWKTLLILSGAPYVADSRVENGLLFLALATAGITEGRHSSIALPVAGVDSYRLLRALDLLFEDHCTGVQSAF